MEELKLRVSITPLKTLKTTLYENIMEIKVNGGGGMGGSRETIYCTLLIVKTVDMGFMKVKDVINDEVITINPRYIGTIRTVNITKLFIEHGNSNFKSGKRIQWFKHPTNMKLTFNDDSTLPRVENVSIIKEIKTDDHNY